MVVDQKAHADGARAARKAIANGVPRWIQLTGEPFSEIHAETGLPIARLSAPNDLADSLQSYAKGFNDGILAGIQSGTVHIDFRPLLMTRHEVQNALATCFVGTLSTDNPKIESPQGDFVIEIVKPKSKSKSKQTWISYNHKSAGRWPNFDLYAGPMRVATGRSGRVLVFETEFLYLTRDVMTTQVLNRYRLAEG